ncbi:phosphorylated adapter RNA export protein-like [Amphibalanus amphitrite]|uniref:phosphorylated adapter RNA export protein-like n=1 Tax=Amphibalanus amphitrite TaxID=1232801 RepID=UPI001C92367E|nr:phosphorylated adapter RNA export protein-like [Amphibalanus amphitrite]XP_043240705.1 phosphorylated adapter RNA export protein-like [Amphibalanus amphitrite]
MEVEDGEIIESEEELLKEAPDTLEVYTCLERPVAPRPPPIQPPPLVSDDSDSPAAADSSDSDSDSGGGRKRARPTPAAAAAGGDSMDTGHNAEFAEAARKFQARRARLAVWSSVLAEDGITEDLAGGLGQLRSGKRVERDVESYQLPELPPRPERPSADNPRKRGFQQASQGWRKKKVESVVLEPLAVTEDSPTEQVAADIALKLREEKPEIIANVVKIIGTKKSIELFEETKSVEEGGGMLVNNWSRRRTPGGVFIQLLKTDPEVTEEQVRDVFREDRRQRDRERKVAKRRRQRARLAAVAAAAGADGSGRESGEASSESGDEDSDADSEAAQSAGSRSERLAADGADDEPPAAEMTELGDGDELEVPNEIIFE